MTRSPVKPGACLGEGAVLVDGVGDRGVDAARLQRRRVGGPDVEVLAAVTGRGVDETGAGVVGDVVAGEQRHGEIVAGVCTRERMAQRNAASIVARNIANLS